MAQRSMFDPLMRVKGPTNLSGYRLDDRPINAPAPPFFAGVGEHDHAYDTTESEFCGNFSRVVRSLL